MIDIDYFKYINDIYGYEVGDDVLCVVVVVVVVYVCDQDLIVWFGGEEFCLFVLGLDQEVVLIYFECLCQVIVVLEVNLGEMILCMIVSIGLCCLCLQYDLLYWLIFEVDCQFYLVKVGGCNWVNCIMVVINVGVCVCEFVLVF